MRKRCWILALCAFSCLLLAGLLLSSRMTVMAVQPTTQDWAALRKHAQATRDRYQEKMAQLKKEAIAAETTRQLIVTQDGDRKPSDRYGYQGLTLLSDGPSQQEINAAITTANATLRDLNSICAWLNTPPKNRTRARYIDWRRKIRQYDAQLDQLNIQHHGINEAGIRVEPSFAELDARVKQTRQHPSTVTPSTLRPKGLSFTWQDYPHIDGSTTTQPLSTLIACRALGLASAWQTRSITDYINGENTHENILVPVYGESPMLPPVDLYDQTTAPGLRVSMEHSGTGTAYRNLILGISNIILVARPPSSTEVARAKQQGITFDVTPIAYDAFVFLLHHSNPLSSLTTKQIKAIYRGDVISWAEFGGKAKHVTAFQRDEHSGSQDTMKSLVMKGQEMIPPEADMIGGGMGGPYNQLNSEPDGIGYTFYYYHTYQSPDNDIVQNNGDARSPERPVKIRKICAVNGVMPTPDTIRNHTYPYVTEVFAVVRHREKAGSPALRQRDWLLTPEGQALVQESGYVPLRKR